MMVYDEHGVPVADTTGMPYSKAKAKAHGNGPRSVVWPPCPQNMQGTDVDPTARANLMVAHSKANRHLRNYTRKYMFKFWSIEKRRRAIVMRENMARRTFLRVNPQHGPFRPVDIYECSSDSDDEPTYSVAPAASDVPTAAPGLPSQPVARIDRVLDVLNAQGSARQEFQAYFNPRNLGPGDMEELSPEAWEICTDLADEEAQGTEQDLAQAAGPSTAREEIPIADIPQNHSIRSEHPRLHRDIVIKLQAREKGP